MWKSACFNQILHAAEMFLCMKWMRRKSRRCRWWANGKQELREVVSFGGRSEWWEEGSWSSFGRFQLEVEIGIRFMDGCLELEGVIMMFILKISSRLSIRKPCLESIAIRVFRALEPSLEHPIHNCIPYPTRPLFPSSYRPQCPSLSSEKISSVLVVLSPLANPVHIHVSIQSALPTFAECGCEQKGFSVQGHSDRRNFCETVFENRFVMKIRKEHHGSAQDRARSLVRTGGGGGPLRRNMLGLVRP